MRRRYLSPLALAAALAVADAQALGLLEAHAKALAHDPAFQSARAALAAGREHHAIGRAGLLPQVTLDYQQSPRNAQEVRNRLANGTEQESARRYSSYAGTLTITQPVFDAGAWARYKQGTAHSLMAGEQFRTQSQDMLLRLAKAYAEALHAQERVALAVSQKEAHAEQLRRNRRAFELGDGTRTDIAETQALLSLAEVELIDAQDALEAARRAVQAVTGASPQEAAALDGLRPDFAQAVAPRLATEPFTHWQALALANNADLAAQRYGLEAARHEIRRQEAGHLPTLKLYAQHARNESEIGATYNQRYQTNSVGVLFNVTLFAGGGISASARQAAHEFESARHLLDARREEVLLDLQKQHRLSESGPARIAAALQAVRSAETALEGNRRGVTAGERVNADVLDAVQRLHAARRDLSRAVYDTLNARLTLRYRAGVLDEAFLREVAGHFTAGDGGLAPLVRQGR